MLILENCGTKNPSNRKLLSFSPSFPFLHFLFTISFSLNFPHFIHACCCDGIWCRSYDLLFLLKFIVWMHWKRSMYSSLAEQSRWMSLKRKPCILHISYMHDCPTTTTTHQGLCSAAWIAIFSINQNPFVFWPSLLHYALRKQI